MSPSNDSGESERSVCQWVSQSQALGHFAGYRGLTQSQQHIKPLHWYVACRLVLEGGFRPDEITPRPPFSYNKHRGELALTYDPALGRRGEATILGGLKTKNVDVVVAKEGLGPVLAVSCKGMTGAFRNLTNRMEETIGECTNLHITYPALVFAYLFVIRANQQQEEAIAGAASEQAPAARQLAANDISIRKGGEPVESIIRFHSALRELSGRRGIRDDVSRYEAVSLAMIDMRLERAGSVLASFPSSDSVLRIEQFFKTMYLRYDERYVYSAPELKKVTNRLEWSPSSPALQTIRSMAPEFEPRVTGGASSLTE